MHKVRFPICMWETCNIGKSHPFWNIFLVLLNTMWNEIRKFSDRKLLHAFWQNVGFSDWSQYKFHMADLDRVSSKGSSLRCYFLTDAYSSGYLVLSRVGLVFVLMLRPFSHELVMFSDFEFRISSVLLFCLTLKTKWKYRSMFESQSQETRTG